MHLKLVSLTYLIIILLKFIKCDVADETEDRLSKFRDDINQISVDFENFVYDILKEVFSGTDSIVNPQRNFLKMIKYPNLNRNSLKDIIHKYAIRDTTTKPTEVDNYLDDYLEKTQNLLKEKTNKLLKKNRIKRSTINCEESTTLEKQHLEDLKIEIKKLNNLISTLKNQHKTITTLNSTPKFIQENITRSTHEELEQIKFELKETVAALNETKELLEFERNRERELEAELNRQRIELNIVKVKLEKLLNRTNEDEVVGEVLDFNSAIKEKERSSDLDTLIKELEKKKKEENLKKLVKSLMNDDRKKLDSKIESKSDDEDLELELEKLEEAIDNLQPKDDFGGTGKDNTGSLTRRQINELRKRLEQISKANSFNGNVPYYNFDRRGFGYNPYFYPPYQDPSMFRPQFLPNYRRFQIDPKFFPPQSGVYTTDNSDGTNQNQSGAYSETSSQYKSIDELKTQVDNLQNIINSLSYSSYKKPEDQQTIAGLEQQVNELKNVINSLSQDQTYNQPTNTPYTRRKRSTYSSDKDLFGEITSRFKRYLFQPEVGEIQGKIDEIKLEKTR